VKKRIPNVIDILIILTLVACVAGIIVRAVNLPSVITDKNGEYRMAFTASLTEEQTSKIDPGLKFKDKNGSELKLLEGYWIKYENGEPALNGELLLTGRLTETGFICGGIQYYEGDTVTLTGKDMTFTVTVLGFEPYQP
jgi:hypothetical protein